MPDNSFDISGDHIIKDFKQKSMITLKRAKTDKNLLKELSDPPNNTIIAEIEKPKKTFCLTSVEKARAIHGKCIGISDHKVEEIDNCWARKDYSILSL